MELYQKKELIESLDIKVLDFQSLKQYASEGFLKLAIRIGLTVFKLMMEEEATEMVGAKWKHIPDRVAYRHGTEDTQIVLGGAKIKTERLRVRDLDGNEMHFESLDIFQNEDPLNDTVLERLVSGVSTRKYERVLDFTYEDISCISKSEVSRRFTKAMETLMDEFFDRSLKGSYPAMLIDSIRVGGLNVVAAMGIDNSGHKQILGIKIGETEDSEVVKALFADLINRGLDVNEPRLYVIDGAKALLKAIKDTFGTNALIQRCQVHKKRNVLSYLPETERDNISIAMTNAYNEPDYEEAKAALMRIHRNLKHRCPEAANSLMEGMEETLTVHKLKVPRILRQTLSSTNALESANSVCKSVVKRVNRFQSGNDVLRHAAAGFMEAERGFRRIKGYKQIPILQSALARMTGVRNNPTKQVSA
jgi:transposase-like protein